MYSKLNYRLLTDVVIIYFTGMFVFYTWKLSDPTSRDIPD